MLMVPAPVSLVSLAIFVIQVCLVKFHTYINVKDIDNYIKQGNSDDAWKFTIFGTFLENNNRTNLLGLKWIKKGRYLIFVKISLGGINSRLF